MRAALFCARALPRSRCEAGPQTPKCVLASKDPAATRRILGLSGYQKINMSLWKTGLADKWDQLTEVVTIAMVGKYTELSDAYLSVTKALQHACLAANRKLKLEWVEASNLEPATKEEDPKAHSGMRQRAGWGWAAGRASSRQAPFQQPFNLPAGCSGLQWRGRSCGRRTACWCRAGLVGAAWRERSWRPTIPAPATSPTSASAWACRLR